MMLSGGGVQWAVGGERRTVGVDWEEDFGWKGETCVCVGDV
jgi:hypothetical protein